MIGLIVLLLKLKMMISHGNRLLNCQFGFLFDIKIVNHYNGILHVILKEFVRSCNRPIIYNYELYFNNRAMLLCNAGMELNLFFSMNDEWRVCFWVIFVSKFPHINFTICSTRPFSQAFKFFKSIQNIAFDIKYVFPKKFLI